MKKRKKMMRVEPPCEGHQKTSGAQSGGLVSGQGAAAGQGTKARHRVPPRLMDLTSPMCAALPTSWGSKQGSVPGLLVGPACFWSRKRDPPTATYADY